jgi:hypothetical protein
LEILSARHLFQIRASGLPRKLPIVFRHSKSNKYLLILPNSATALYYARRIADNNKR